MVAPQRRVGRIRLLTQDCRPGLSSVVPGGAEASVISQKPAPDPHPGQFYCSLRIAALAQGTAGVIAAPFQNARAGTPAPTLLPSYARPAPSASLRAGSRGARPHTFL